MAPQSYPQHTQVDRAFPLESASATNARYRAGKRALVGKFFSSSITSASPGISLIAFSISSGNQRIGVFAGKLLSTPVFLFTVMALFP